MKFAILGAGAMGCLYGAKLQKAGQDVIMLDHNMNSVEALRTYGIRLVTKEGEEQIPVAAYLSKEYREPVDVLIVFTKGNQSRRALAALNGAIGPNTILASFQNGIGHDAVLAEYASPDHIIIGTSNFPSERIEYGKVTSFGVGVTRMMTASGEITPALTQMEQIFKTAGLNPEIFPEILAAIWEKAAFNAAVNSISAIMLMPQGVMSLSDEGRELSHNVITEACSVAEKKGLPVNSERVHNTLDNLLHDHFNHIPSMLQDVLGERNTEIDSINGAIVAEAKNLGVEVPVINVLNQLVTIVQQNYGQRMVVRR